MVNQRHYCTNPKKDLEWLTPSYEKEFFGFLLQLHVARFWFPLRETAVFVFNRGFAGSPTGEFSWLRPPGGDREFLSFSSSLLFPRRRDFYRKNKSNFYDHVLCDHIFFGSLMVEGSENRSLRIFWIGARYMRRTRGPSALSRGGESAAPNDLTRGTNEPQPPIYSHA